MSRILLGWELGMNLGHMARLQPVARRLQADGHTLLAAMRDLQGASSFFGPLGVPFVPAPHLPRALALAHKPGCYADILLSHGWGELEVLRGLVRAWRTLFDLFGPDLLVLDFSPTAQLAARIAGIPVMCIGNGFELPPPVAPLPPFPGFSWASLERAAQSEARALTNANAVLRECGGSGLDALCELFDVGAQVFATFAELDHYGARPEARYIGPMLASSVGDPANWPDGSGRCVFAYLRPNTPSAETILAGLRVSKSRVVCFAPGFAKERLATFAGDSIRFAAGPVDLASLRESADACVTYGAEGTALPFLLAGVPQLLTPSHIESQMVARRLEDTGAALVLRGPQTAEGVALMLEQVAGDGPYRVAARAFAQRHRDFQAEQAVTDAVALIESLLVGGEAPGSRRCFDSEVAARETHGG
jgi:UDP:flavonoid glycosyltransferase YjiC (YdhE family)